MEKQEKKNKEISKVEISKVEKRRGKKEMDKLLTNKTEMDKALRKIKEMEKMRDTNKVVDLSKVNDKKVKKVNGEKVKNTIKVTQPSTKDTQPSTTKRKSSGYVWVKKRIPSKESQTLKIYTNPLDRTRAALLDKLERKLNDYFSVVPEDLKKVNVLKVLQSLKGNKTITVSIGECSYIFEGEKIESNEKFKDPRIKEIISTMVKSLRNL